MGDRPRQAYPSDVAPYLCLIGEDAPQREHGRREVLTGLRWLAIGAAEPTAAVPDGGRSHETEHVLLT